MRAARIAGVSRRRRAPITTRQATDHRPASDLVRRNFMAERPNALWVADDRRRFRSHSEARMAVFQFIEGFYNPSRRHSALGYLSPIEYERKHHRLTNPPKPQPVHQAG